MNENSILEIIISLFNCPANKHKVTALIRTLSYTYREMLASSKNTHTDILTILSTDEDSRVRGYVAENQATPIATLEKLANDTYYHIRECVAYNLSTPATILEKLSTDKDDFVRECVAVNPSTSTAILEILAKDNDLGIQTIAIKILAQRNL